MTQLVFLFLLLLLNKCTCINTIIPIFFLTNTYDNDGPPSPTKYVPSDYVAIQIIIFAATLMLLIIISLILCKICNKQLRSRAEFENTATNMSTFERVFRQRMEERPPTYNESQQNIEMLPQNDPPSYSEVMRHARTCSIFTINKAEPLIDNADSLSCSSDPPSYATLEGINNPSYLVEDSDRTERNQNRHVITIDQRNNVDLYI